MCFGSSACALTIILQDGAIKNDQEKGGSPLFVTYKGTYFVRKAMRFYQFHQTPIFESLSTDIFVVVFINAYLQLSNKNLYYRRNLKFRKAANILK